MFSSQFGHGLTQMTPADENIPQELRDFFRDEQPWGTDLNLRQVYIRNFIAFAILKPIIAVPVLFLDIYAMIVHL